MTTSYDALPFRARRNGSENPARALASGEAAGAAIFEHGTPVSGRDVLAAWTAAALLGALCLFLLAT